MKNQNKLCTWGPQCMCPRRGLCRRSVTEPVFHAEDNSQVGLSTITPTVGLGRAFCRGVANLSFVRVEMGADYCTLHVVQHFVVTSSTTERCVRRQWRGAPDSKTREIRPRGCITTKAATTHGKLVRGFGTPSSLASVACIDCSMETRTKRSCRACVQQQYQRKSCAELPRPHPIIAHQGQRACWAHRDHLHARILHHQTHTPHPGKHTTHSSRSGLSRGALRQ